MAGLERGTVSLKDYKEEWKKLYREEVYSLKNVLGSKILEFKHIGSTSVPGLKAKPIIDMIAAVRNLDDVEKIVSKLEENGYELRPKDKVENRIFLAKGPRDNRTHYLSLTEKNSKFYRRTLKFRDLLRENPQKASTYEKLKEDLAEKYPQERKKYTEKKSKFIEQAIIDLSTKE